MLEGRLSKEMGKKRRRTKDSADVDESSGSITVKEPSTASVSKKRRVEESGVAAPAPGTTGSVKATGSMDQRSGSASEAKSKKRSTKKSKKPKKEKKAKKDRGTAKST